MSEAESGKITLKLLVDRNVNRVIFGEAGKDFVDFLFHFLSLPVGTVVKLLSSGKMIGSIGKIYESIKAMDPNYMEPNFNKQHLLNPKVSSTSTTSIGDNNPLLLGYKSYDHVPEEVIIDEYGFVTSFGGPIASYTTPVQVDDQGGPNGYVKGLVTYMVMDDLRVKPMSTICSITLLNTFQVKDLAALQTLEVSIGRQEAVELLKASLVTDKVLTSLFLDKNKA